MRLYAPGYLCVSIASGTVVFVPRKCADTGNVLLKNLRVKQQEKGFIAIVGVSLYS